MSENTEKSIILKDGKIYHADHDFKVEISNANTKHEKTCTIVIRGDVVSTMTIKAAVKAAEEFYTETMKVEPIEEEMRIEPRE